MDLPSIYEYNNYRRYLDEYQKARVKTDRSFSATNICRRLGLPHTRSFFRDVVSGKNITSTFIERFIPVLGLDEDEARFFRVLVLFNQAETAEEREMYFDQLISLNKTPKVVIERSKYCYYREWYHSAILAMLDISEFKGDCAALSRRLIPPISAAQARESIKLLKSLDLICENEDGILKPTYKAMINDQYARDELVAQYQLRCMELARRARFVKPEMPRRYSESTFTVSEHSYRQIERETRKFRDKIRSLIHKDTTTADRVYKMNMQLFPLSLPAAKS